MSKVVIIYALRDPCSGAIRYVGKTVCTPRRRLQGHLAKSRDQKNGSGHCHRWIRQLLRKGLRPRIEVLEETDRASWQERERYWIVYGKSEGWPLTNETAGGDGAESLSLEARRKISEAAKGNQRWLGRKHSQETRHRLSRMAMGRPSAFKGHSHSEATKAKLAESSRRHSRGEHNGNSKLTSLDVENIQRAYLENSITQW